VTPATGYTVPVGPRATIVAALQEQLHGLAADPAAVRRVGQRARERVLSAFTWEAKARMVLEVYRWVIGARGRPDFASAVASA